MQKKIDFFKILKCTSTLKWSVASPRYSTSKSLQVLIIPSHSKIITLFEAIFHFFQDCNAF